jgi:hypothetical protein
MLNEIHKRPEYHILEEEQQQQQPLGYASDDI